MKIALIQTEIAWNDPVENLARCEILAKEAISRGAGLLIFPEMFTTGFSMPEGATAELAGSLGLSFLTTQAARHGVYTIGSLPEVAPTGELFNTAWICRPDSSRVSYRKMHLFSYGRETELYSAGSDVTTASIGDLRITPFVCYDLRFGAPFSALAEQTDLYVVVANWPSSRREHWLTLLRARAIENQAYIAGVNRVGSGGGLHYSGDSALFGPDGSELARMGDDPGFVTCDIESENVSQWRETFPALKDRRPEIYRSLTQRST